uniref:Uncharacterized protein n=1 Tax=Arundo donax TaxID=35708 RepID=A0A0A8YAG7_ARUDO
MAFLYSAHVKGLYRRGTPGATVSGSAEIRAPSGGAEK